MAITFPPVDVEPTLIIRVSPLIIFLTLSVLEESDLTPSNLLRRKNCA